MLEKLEKALHYTYSFWPSSEAIKKQVEMQFYQKPIYNYRLECELEPDKSLDTLLSNLFWSEVT